MKRNFRLDIRKVLISFGVAVVLFLGACVYLRSVSIPDHGTANEVSTFTMHCFAWPRISGGGSAQAQLVVGFLAPKDWNVGKNSTVTYTSPKGDGTMSLMPAGTKEITSGLEWPSAARQKLGIGGNLVDDVEWTVFVCDKAVTVNNMDTFSYDVTLKVKLGADNMLVKLGFFNAEMADGFSDPGMWGNPYYAYFFSDCFAVTGGEGNVIDFCNPQLSAISPRNSLDNDIISLTYDNGLLSTDLSDKSDIYLGATAYTSDGSSYNVSEKSLRTKLNPIGGKKYRIDFWPKGFFNVPKDKTIDRIEYYCTDASGSIKVGYANTSSPFLYSFICKN